MIVGTAVLNFPHHFIYWHGSSSWFSTDWPEAFRCEGRPLGRSSVFPPLYHVPGKMKLEILREKDTWTTGFAGFFLVGVVESRSSLSNASTLHIRRSVQRQIPRFPCRDTGRGFFCGRLQPPGRTGAGGWAAAMGPGDFVPPASGEGPDLPKGYESRGIAGASRRLRST